MIAAPSHCPLQRLADHHNLAAPNFCILDVGKMGNLSICLLP